MQLLGACYDVNRLKCGLLGSALLLARARAADLDGAMKKASFSFVQISDSHIGFFPPGVNTDVAATLKEAIARINALPEPPDFILHTGDLTHLAAADEFDTLDQLLKSVKTQQIFYVPGEHDVTGDNGKLYLERFGKNTKGQGWHSFDHNGVHFVGLVNVVDIQQNGLGALGNDQMEWLEADLKDRSSETPVSKVVFAHISTVVGVSAMGLGHGRRRAGVELPETVWLAITVLNGHIYQTMKKVEGRWTSSTPRCPHAFPQLEPGKAGSKPGPMEGGVGGEIAGPAGHHRCQLHRGEKLAGGGGLNTGLICCIR